MAVFFTACAIPGILPTPDFENPLFHFSRSAGFSNHSRSHSGVCKRPDEDAIKSDMKYQIDI